MSEIKHTLPTAQEIHILHSPSTEHEKLAHKQIQFLRRVFFGDDDSNKLKIDSAKVDREQHVVWIFDNIAYKPLRRSDQGQAWQVEIVACVFGRERRTVGRYVAKIADFIGIDGRFGEDPIVQRRIIQRLQSLLYVVAPNRSLSIDMPLPGGTAWRRFHLGPTDRDGVLRQTIAIPDIQITNSSTVITSELTGSDGEVCMQTRFASPNGWLVISDIDDSIKITLTSEAVGILQSTFVADPRPILGMPELYRRIDNDFNPTWIYLSASPYNLYQFLRGFLHSFYPRGTLLLREIGWKDIVEFIKSCKTGTRIYKEKQIDKIYGWLPGRKVICVGDSTQSDPEVYAEMYRKHKHWIRAIFIRKVCDIPHMTKRNSPARFRRAFRGVPEDVWRIFEHPSDLHESLVRL